MMMMMMMMMMMIAIPPLPLMSQPSVSNRRLSAWRWVGVAGAEGKRCHPAFHIKKIHPPIWLRLWDEWMLFGDWLSMICSTFFRELFDSKSMRQFQSRLNHWGLDKMTRGIVDGRHTQIHSWVWGWQHLIQDKTYQLFWFLAVSWHFLETYWQFSKLCNTSSFSNLLWTMTFNQMSLDLQLLASRWTIVGWCTSAYLPCVVYPHLFSGDHMTFWNSPM